MSHYWMWLVLICSLCIPFVRAGPHDWLLYSDDEQQTDCFLYINRYFCRSTDGDIPAIERNATCVHGVEWSFQALKRNGVTTDDLIDWLIPFHVIEEYAAYVNSIPSHATDTATLCQCTSTRVGTQCEYEIIARQIGIPDAVKNQQGTHRDNNEEIPTSLVDEMPCNAGALALEWRQICDGLVQCQDAADETDCHLLEFNTCGADEFQCRNGMCIPREFLFDSTPDCMDSSDEQEFDAIVRFFDDCTRDSTIDCHERLCVKDQFSCGDGQCIEWSALIHQSDGCDNAREAAFICETVDQRMNTNVQFNGLCQHTSRPSLRPLTNTSDCISSLRHLLAANRRSPSNEIRATSFRNMIALCPELIQYPEQTVLSPVLKMYYNRSRIEIFYGAGKSFHQQMPRKPHLFCLHGSMVCQSTWTTLKKDHCLSQDDFQKLTSSPFFPISHLFCRTAATQASVKGLTVVQKLPNAPLSYACQNTSDRVSQRRVNDGYIDCLYGDDEKNSIDTTAKPFRYRCQTVTSPAQFVSYQQLGNGIRECDDGSDEISRDIRWTSFRCNANDNYACWVFQGDTMREERMNDLQLPFHRYCDSVRDTMDGHDEQNCSQWMCPRGSHQCKRTGQCINTTYLCDGEFDCDDGEDELNCPRNALRWTLEFVCNSTSEHFCITPTYMQNQTLARPCISYVQAGDGKVDCVGGRDERNVFFCSDRRELGDRFLCDNSTRCIHHWLLCNGRDDCVDRTDELICFWGRRHCKAEQFACPEGNVCRNSLCDTKSTCPNRSNWFWCPNSNSTVGSPYRSSKYNHQNEYAKSCYSNATTPVAPKTEMVVLPRASQQTRYGLCNRGFYLTSDSRERFLCFCPPSYYGDRCQFDSRRINIRVRFDRHHRSDIPSSLTILALLVYNRSEIVHHQYFADIDADYPPKANLYLVYPRPRPRGLYTVRLEAYYSTQLLGAWEYSISPLDFLPSFRLAKELRFPERSLPWLCIHNPCRNNGTCYMMSTGQHLCLCQRGWSGISCENPLEDVRCAPHSLVRDRRVCICPIGYLEPHCFVRKTVCDKSRSCSSDTVCYPGVNQPPNWYRCACNGTSCDSRTTFIIIHRQETNPLPYLLQLLEISTDYPRVRQQILVHPSTGFPMVRTIKTRDIRNAQGVVPEIGLLFTFEPRSQSVDIALHLLYINCSKSLRNYTVDLAVQPQRCRSVDKNEFHSLTVLRNFCQATVRDPCFLLEGYICYCSSPTIKQSECISYHQRFTTCRHCLNQGYCAQGDLRNQSDFACVCPKCVSGKLCQFSISRFSISLEFLIDKVNWEQYHFVGPFVFLLVGLIFNGLSLITFVRPRTRQNAVGVFLFANSIVSQFVLISLFIRVVYLYLARHMFIAQNINLGLCKGLPYVMFSLYYVSLWLMALVTIERALIATQCQRFMLIRSATSAVILTILTSIVILGSNYIHISSYRLVSHPDDAYPWCISEIEPKQQALIQYTSLAHQIVPFVVNLLAGLVIIGAISRSKANSHHITARRALAQQARKRIDLLLGPTICFMTQLPQLIILFLDVCGSSLTSWFIHVILIAYYISFSPQISLFFLYVLPSPLYKDTLRTETAIGKQLARIATSIARRMA